MRDIHALKEKLLDTGKFYNNEYLDLYCSLIAERETEKVLYKTQLHHILPRAYYKAIGLVIDDSEENIVALLHRDHVLAHIYLALCFSDDYLAGASKQAVCIALQTPYVVTAEEFKKMKEDFILLDEYQRAMEIAFHFTDEHREKISAALKGAQKGVPKSEEFKQHLRDYYKEHPKTGTSLSTEQRQQIGESVRRYWEGLDASVKEERNNAISMKLKGRPKPPGFSEHLSATRKGENNPMYGKKHSAEQLEKMSQHMKLNNPFKGKHHTAESKQKAVNTRRLNGSYRPRVGVNNGTISKFVYQEELDSYLLAGYKKGTLPRKRKEDNEVTN